MGFKFLEKELCPLWKPQSAILLADLANGFYIARFNCETDYDTTLYKGPWIVADHYLTGRQWRPNFDPDEVAIDNVAVWVRIPNHPIEYYDKLLL